MAETGLLHVLYRRVAGEHPGEGAVEFIKHLSWIGASFAAAKVISALVNIAAGRMLGPAEYGRITVLVSAGAAISPFIIAGLNNAVIRYGVDPAYRGRVFFTSGMIFLGLAATASAMVLCLRPQFCAAFALDPRMLALALCYALASSLFLLASGMRQAVSDFSGRGFGEIGFSLVLAAVFFLYIYRAGRGYEAMAWAYIAAFGGVALFWLFKSRNAGEFSLLHGKKLSELGKYAGYSFGGGIGYYLMLNVQGLLLNAHLTPEEVGVYAAYNTATIGIAAYLGYAIGTVLFPKASGSTNRRRLWDLAVRGWAVLAPLSVIAFLLAEAAVISLMGRHQYGLRPDLMVLFAVSGALMLAHSSLAQIIFSEGVKASRLSLFMAWGGGLLNLAACLVLIPVLKVGGAAVAFILTYIFLISWLWKVKDSYL